MTPCNLTVVHSTLAVLIIQINPVRSYTDTSPTGSGDVDNYLDLLKSYQKIFSTFLTSLFVIVKQHCMFGLRRKCLSMSCNIADGVSANYVRGLAATRHMSCSLATWPTEQG